MNQSFLRSGTPILALLLAGLLAFACDTDKSAGASDGRPEAALQATILDTGEIDVRVGIPDHHHAYLDAGREGMLIPVSFHWDLNGQTAAPVAKTKPIGDLYEEAGAQVLRGEGRWIFTPAGPVNGGEVKIRTQICDEIKGVCYPPKKTAVTLQKADASS